MADGDRFVPPEMEYVQSRVDPTHRDIESSPCKSRPDTNPRRPCILHILNQPKHNEICETCYFIPWGKGRIYRTEEEILKIISKKGILITEIDEDSPQKKKRKAKKIRINWKRSCKLCGKLLPNKGKVEYCSFCSKIRRIRNKRYRKKNNGGLPPESYLNRPLTRREKELRK
jgi:hypothetical protein